MNTETILIIVLLALLAAVAVWARWRVVGGQTDLVLLQWLGILATELLANLPADMVDEAAARAWLLQQIERFAQAHGLETLFQIFPPAYLVDKLLDLLAGRWQFRLPLDGTIQAANAARRPNVWPAMLAERRVQI